MNAILERPGGARPPSAGEKTASGWPAELCLGFERRGDRTALVHCSHRGPLRLQKPLYPEGPGVCHGIVLHPPAGIAGGDTLDLAVSVGRAAHTLLTTPGAGKWYRSAGAPARLVQRIRVAAEGLCEWLPQESIVFDGAIGALATEVDLEGDARFIGTEMLCFGRTGSGERYERGKLSLRTTIRRDGRPVWIERGVIPGASPLLDSPAGLGGHPVTGTLVVAAGACNAAMRDACREVAPAAGVGAVTLLPGLIVARYLGPACEPGRQWFARLWECVRPAVAGVPMRVPRIWNT